MKTLFKIFVVSLIASMALVGCSSSEPELELGAVINMFEAERYSIIRSKQCD